MRVTTLLNELSETLADPEHDLLVKAEQSGDEELLSRVADALVSCSYILKMAAAEAEEIEPPVSVEQIEEIAALATEFDASGDELLRKQASLMDEILLTIGSKKNPVNPKLAQDTEEDRLRAKYREQASAEVYSKAHEQQQKEIGAEEAIKDIEKRVKTFRPLEAPLNTRYDPDMPGVLLMRVGDGVFQSPVTKKIYNYNAGFTTANGDKVPGSSVENQTQMLGFRAPEHMNFSSREEVLNGRS